jgi:diguanylate cyclase (GGDEF)-like protein
MSSGAAFSLRRVKDLPLARTRVSPDTRVEDALRRLQSSAETVAAVIQGEEVVGLLPLEAAILADPSSPVKEAMGGIMISVDGESAARDAARQLVMSGASAAVVMDGESLLGVVSSLMLLKELGRSWDPMTGLSWSDQLREWGAHRLQEGQEITIVFFDLDDFKRYNKNHGHVVGDRVLRGIADMIAANIDPERDVLVRYGGDEFVVGTTRDRSQTVAWLRPFARRVTDIEGVPEPVRFSFGISGGKRTHDRPGEHAVSNLDDLINLASRACLASKTWSKEASVPEPSVPPTEGAPHAQAYQDASGGLRVRLGDTVRPISEVGAGWRELVDAAMGTVGLAEADIQFVAGESGPSVQVTTPGGTVIRPLGSQPRVATVQAILDAALAGSGSAS